MIMQAASLHGGAAFTLIIKDYSLFYVGITYMSYMTLVILMT